METEIVKKKLKKIICAGSVFFFEKEVSLLEVSFSKDYTRWIIIYSHLPRLLNTFGYLFNKNGEYIWVEDSLSSVLTFGLMNKNPFKKNEGQKTKSLKKEFKAKRNKNSPLIRGKT